MAMTHKESSRLATLATEMACEQGLNIAVTVADRHGELLAFQKMDNVSFHAAYLSRCKAYTAAREGFKSSEVGQYAKDTNRDLANWCDNMITGIAGGIPVFVAGKLVGALAIAGLHEKEDEEFAEKVLGIYLKE